MIWHKNNSFDYYHCEPNLFDTQHQHWTEANAMAWDSRWSRVCLFWCPLPSSSSSLPPSNNTDWVNNKRHTLGQGIACEANGQKKSANGHLHILREMWKAGGARDDAMEMRQYRSMRTGQMLIVYTILIRHRPRWRYALESIAKCGVFMLLFFFLLVVAGFWCVSAGGNVGRTRQGYFMVLCT